MTAYLLAVFVLIAATTAVSTLLCTLLSGVVSSLLLSISNMRPVDMSVPTYLYCIYIAMALVVPMIIAFFPVRRGLKISVRDALNDYGICANEKPMKLPEPKHLSRPVLLSLRNAVRRKRRFVLNVTILSVAGAIFVSLVTTMISLQLSLNDNVNRWKFDYQLTTNDTYSDEQLKELTAKIPRVTGYENWGISQGVLVNSVGESIRTYPLTAPPNGSTMLEPDIIEGRWLNNTDVTQIVVSHSFFQQEPGYSVGDEVSIKIGGEIRELTIVGSMKNFGEASIFISETGFNQFVSQADRLSNIKLSLDMTGNRSRAVYSEVDAALEELNVRAMQTQAVYQTRCQHQIRCPKNQKLITRPKTILCIW
jgi:putative ABC transport system permease protein